MDINKYRNGIVVQFRTDKSLYFGTLKELDWRTKMEEKLGALLETYELGYCDGGMAGAGAMEIILIVDDVEATVRVVMDLLTHLELIGYCKIVSGTPENVVVHHPQGATFSLWDFGTD